MKIYGYSERGMVNSFFYECQDNPELLKGFFEILNKNNGLSLDVKETTISGAQLFIEQGLSDFGDADVIIITEYNIVFIEAKVNARGGWYVNDQYKEFKKLFSGSEKPSISNVFVQLFLKEIFIDALSNCIKQSKLSRNKIKMQLELALNDSKFNRLKSKKWSENEQKETEIAVGSSTGEPEIKNRKIGDNPVILDFVAKFLLPALETKAVPIFVSLVPDCIKETTHKQENTKDPRKYIEVLSLSDFFSGVFKKENKVLNSSNWGYISWENISKSLLDKMPKTKRIFDFNKHNQIVCKFPNIVHENNTSSLIDASEAKITYINSSDKKGLYCFLDGGEDKENIVKLSDESRKVKKTGANKLSMRGIQTIIVSKDLSLEEFKNIENSLKDFWYKKWYF